MTNEMWPLDQVGSFRGPVEAVPDALLMIDSDGQITLVNAHSEQLFGYSRSQLLGKHYESCFPRGSRASEAASGTSLPSDPGIRRAGTDLKRFGLHRDGSEFPIEVSFAPLGVGRSPRWRVWPPSLNLRLTRSSV